MTDQFKTCSKCGEVKAVELFRRNRNQCKMCRAEWARKWAADNPEKVVESNKKWVKQNRAKVAENHRSWREKNIERALKNESKSREKNREKTREKARHNQPKRAQYCKLWKRNNSEKVKLYDAKSVANLADSYVRDKVRRCVEVNGIGIPPELIEVKRKHLQILRALKEKPNEHKIQKSR